MEIAGFDVPLFIFKEIFLKLWEKEASFVNLQTWEIILGHVLGTLLFDIKSPVGSHLCNYQLCWG